MFCLGLLLLILWSSFALLSILNGSSKTTWRHALISTVVLMTHGRMGFHLVSHRFSQVLSIIGVVLFRLYIAYDGIARYHQQSRLVRPAIV